MHCEREFTPSLLGLVSGLLTGQSGKATLQDAVDYLEDFLGGPPERRQAAPREKPVPKLDTPHPRYTALSAIRRRNLKGG